MWVPVNEAATLFSSPDDGGCHVCASSATRRHPLASRARAVHQPGRRRLIHRLEPAGLRGVARMTAGPSVHSALLPPAKKQPEPHGLGCRSPRVFHGGGGSATGRRAANLRRPGHESAHASQARVVQDRMAKIRGCRVGWRRPSITSHTCAPKASPPACQKMAGGATGEENHVAPKQRCLPVCAPG